MDCSGGKLVSYFRHQSVGAGDKDLGRGAIQLIENQSICVCCQHSLNCGLQCPTEVWHLGSLWLHLKPGLSCAKALFSLHWGHWYMLLYPWWCSCSLLNNTHAFQISTQASFLSPMPQPRLRILLSCFSMGQYSFPLSITECVSYILISGIVLLFGSFKQLDVPQGSARPSPWMCHHAIARGPVLEGLRVWLHALLSCHLEILNTFLNNRPHNFILHWAPQIM